ncbi:hypothetical protein EIP86_006543 [Pleurotus ostreatoroseus]|nr:hypothetical protein EIP86_006543 [Pleurotus ostreatoroseus]
MSTPAAPSSPRTSHPPTPQPSASTDFGHDRSPTRTRDRDDDSDSFSTGRRSPVPAFDSSAALILVSSRENDDDEDSNHGSDDHDDFDTAHDVEHGTRGVTFDFSSDDEPEHRADQDDEHDDREDAALLFRSPSARFRSASFDFGSSPPRTGPASVPLSSLAVFVYLLSPLLKLGALLSLTPPPLNDLSLRASLVSLVFFACLCALARQVWYMLARYVRRADVEEVLIQTVARGRGRGRGGERENRRQIVRTTTRTCTGVLRLLIVAIFLRASADVILPFVPLGDTFIARLATTPVIALFALPLCFAASLASPIALYATWISVAAYVGWVACAVYAHAHGQGAPAAPTLGNAASFGVLWQGISIAAFTFTTTSTLPLYASLRGAHEPGVPKPRRSRSFKLISVLSILFATLLILPTTIFRATSPSESFVNSQEPLPTTPETPNPSPDPSEDQPYLLHASMALLTALTLLLGLPSVLTTAPTLPVPRVIRRRAGNAASRILYLLAALGLAVLPSFVFRVLSDVLLVLAFLSTYAVPALIHITIHNFRRPLSIVMPPAPGTPATPGHPNVSRSDSYNDELLQRKERTLQRRRLVRRLAWDIGVWVLLLPVSGGGLMWTCGRILRRW